MKNKIMRTTVWTVLLTILPIFVGLLLWNKLPAYVPTHFSTHGQPNGWSSKAMTVYGIPLIMAVLQLFLIGATSKDSQHKNVSAKVQRIVYWLIPWTSLIVTLTIYAYALGYSFNADIGPNLLLGVIFILLGNYLPKVKQNRTVGIRVSWTMNSEENWRRTNHLGGWTFVICGIIFLFNMFFQQDWILVVSIVIAVTIPLVYSYYLHRQGI